MLFISRTMLILGMSLCILALSGFVREATANKLMSNLPIWLTFFSAIGALLFLRIKTPLACTQDFRYIPIIIIPISYYIAKGIPKKSLLLHYISLILCLLFVLSCFSFFVMISLY
jgi:hypothetical protein